MSDASGPLRKTPFHPLHVELGARLVPFAGYEMPVQYPTGIVVEHRHTRAAAGLFDVSHMGQMRLTAKPGHDAAEALETLVPGDIRGLASGRMRYTQFTDEKGGILDDLMVASTGDHLMLVVNASRKVEDAAHLRRHLADRLEIEEFPTRALLALQGPQAAAVLGRFAPDCAAMPFMGAAFLTVDGVVCYVTRSGYTGEDGYEISMPGEAAVAIARELLRHPEVKPIGLGARDSLRLEAGLCLHGNDIDETTTPVEAGLVWSIGKRRRESGGFPGAEIVQRQLREGAARKLVGLKPAGRAPVRAHAEIHAGGKPIGTITSGGFGPTVDGPIALGYVTMAHAAPGTTVQAILRDKPIDCAVVPLPFVKHRYFRG
jgi:aminomethyltransferase